MELVVDKLIEFSAGKDEELRDISGLGMCLSIVALTSRLQHIGSFEDYHLRASYGSQDRDESMREAHPQATCTGRKCMATPVFFCVPELI